jgi:hypothetical protein
MRSLPAHERAHGSRRWRPASLTASRRPRRCHSCVRLVGECSTPPTSEARTAPRPEAQPTVRQGPRDQAGQSATDGGADLDSLLFARVMFLHLWLQGVWGDGGQVDGEWARVGVGGGVPAGCAVGWQCRSACRRRCAQAGRLADRRRHSEVDLSARLSIPPGRRFLVAARELMMYT